MNIILCQLRTGGCMNLCQLIRLYIYIVDYIHVK